ncbi:MAG: carbohydrate ABC transporter permease [Oscillospiraceae bacterium]|jgi:multiple sugar transport system permease protein/putative aldouronate transport system permease protein|nr:carbohydrate ABC transporter permease [Oscillospiraceae bacterium]
MNAITRARHAGFKRTTGDAVFHAVNYTVFMLFAFACLFPFYYLFINTISDNELVRIGAIKLIPRGVHFNNYVKLLSVSDIGRSLIVTIYRTVLGTALMVAASAFMGYLVTKQEMFARRVVYRALVATMYFNAGLIPWFLNMSMLGLTGNFWGYVIPSIVSPFNIILVKTYVESLPKELEESATIDGAWYPTVFRRIVFPLCKPVLATIAIFGAVGHWNSFTDSIILMSSQPKLYTLQHRLYIYLNSSSNLGALMSAGSGGTISESAIASTLNMRTMQLTVAMVTILPILFVYPFMQRYFQKGIMIGAVKG